MPKIGTSLQPYKRATKETVDIPRPIVTAFIDVDVNCLECGCHKGFHKKVYINAPEETWNTNKRARRNTKKAMVEQILSTIWNERADNG